MRNSFGRPAGELNNRIGVIIEGHHKRMFKRTPRYKPYSFAKNSLKKTRRAASPLSQEYLNEADAMTLYYSPKFNIQERPQYIPVYNNRNTKRVTVIDKKARKGR
jgi:hypothetical protein